MPDLGDYGTAAVEVWNQMGGDIHWGALPLLASIHALDDMELLVAWLAAIRDEMRARANG